MYVYCQLNLYLKEHWQAVGICGWSFICCISEYYETFLLDTTLKVHLLQKFLIAD